MSDAPLELPPPIEQEDVDTDQVDVVIVTEDDDSSSILAQVRDLETTTSELLDEIDYDPKNGKDTVGEALSLAHEALEFARNKLEKVGR